MIKYTAGDLLKADVDIICHQVNCYGACGAGLAKQIAIKYPKSKKEYISFCREYKPQELLGKLLVTKEKDFYIAHLFGQKEYGKTGLFYKKNKRQTQYPYLKKAMMKLKSRYPNSSYGFPHLMGCGLAGGQWYIVENIIKNVFNNNDVTIFML